MSNTFFIWLKVYFFEVRKLLRQIRSNTFLAVKIDFNWLKKSFMFNQNRIYRVFQLINFLRTRPSKSPRSLAGLLEISERSVYRYIDLMGQLGFEVKRSEAGRFYIESTEEERTPFTAQEVDYIAKMVSSVGKNSILGQSVLHKVGHYTEHQVAARNIYDANLGKIIEQLSIAIQEKKQVMLPVPVSKSGEVRCFVNDRQFYDLRFISKVSGQT